MKMKLAVAFAALLLAGAVRADSSTTSVPPYGVYYPSDATVTFAGLVSISPVSVPNYVVDYTFADGTGFSENPISMDDANFGQVLFTVPVISVTFGWVSDGYFAIGPSVLGSGAGGSGTETLDFANAITGLEWATGDYPPSYFTPGSYGGITSLSYVEETVPEPGTVPLLSLGLIAFVALSRCQISRCN